MLNRDARQMISAAPWAIEMRSVSLEEPERLVRTLSGQSSLPAAGCSIAVPAIPGW